MKKEQPVGYSLFIKDGIEKIIIKDKQHLSFEYIIAQILLKSKYNISIAIYNRNMGGPDDQGYRE